MRLLGRSNSTNVKKVMWCAAELGLPIERIDLGGPFGGLDTSDFREKNPNGLIPCLEDGELILWESNTIVRYLVAEYGEGRLCSDSPANRARCDMWMDWVLSTLIGPFRDLYWNKVRATDDNRDAAAMARGLEDFSRHLTLVDGVLAERPWLSGESFGLGDIPLGCYAYAWFAMDIERPDLPHLSAWYERLCERPSYRQHVMMPLT